MLHLIGGLLIWLVSSFLLSIIWWRLWMYEGFIGSTGVLSRLLQADGESAYDAMLAEMFLVCAIVLGVVALVTRHILRSRSVAGEAR